MQDGRIVSSALKFRGVEHVVALEVSYDQLTVEVEEKSSADQWRATFDSSYIEELTHKTGNFKKFSVFTSMLESAVTQSSSTVSLDLLTYADLENLRNQKAGNKSIAGNRTASILNSKRYLVLTYAVEFDRINYPLALPYVGKPDPKLLQETIRRMKKEMKALKQQGHKDFRLKEFENLKRDYDRLAKEKADIEAAFIDYKREVEITSEGVAVKEVRILKGIIKNLEEELLSTSCKHQRSATKRGQQFRQLQDELSEVKASERNLRVRVKSLTNELAQYKRKGSRAFPNSSLQRDNSRNSSHSFIRDLSNASRNGIRSRDSSLNSRLSDRSVTFRNRSTSRERSHVSAMSRNGSRDSSLNSRLSDRSATFRNRSTSRSHVRPPSRDRSLSRDRTKTESMNGGSFRLRTPSPAGARTPRFDPTAYAAEKERKRKEIKLKQQRGVHSRMSGSAEKKHKTSSPVRSWSETDLIGRNRRVRTPSIESIRSVRSSIESISDINPDDDSTLSKQQMDEAVGLKKPPEGKKGKRNATSKTGNSSNHIPLDIRSTLTSKSTTNTSIKVLSSTPEKSQPTKRRVNVTSNKENVYLDDDESFNHSTEISEIDARLTRLQQFMKDNLQ